jgi:hypothetical protein
MEICIFFTPNKNKRSCCGLTHTLFMAGSQSSSTYILVLYLYRQILVAYKWHFIVNKMIYVTEVCSNQFIRYMIALQSPYMIALSLYSWSRDRRQFIDVQRSHFLELKVNNSFILSIRLISLKDCAVYFNIIICVYLRYFWRKTNCDLWVFMRFTVKVGSLHINKTWRLLVLHNYDEVIRESNYSYTCVIDLLHIRGKHEQQCVFGCTPRA